MTNDYRSYIMLFTFVYDRKNENHWHYSLFITRNTNTRSKNISREWQHMYFFASSYETVEVIEILFANFFMPAYLVSKILNEQFL